MLDDMETRFYDALGSVPDVPAGMYQRISRRARRPSALYRAALAACLTIAVGVGSLMFVKVGAPSAAYADNHGYDFRDDILYTFEYLGGDLNDDDLFIGNQISLLSRD